MPAKKKGAESTVKIRFGRPGNTLRMGIVGVPNVGKSSTFNLLSNMSVPAENYPFCTIDPNEARVPIPDARFTRLCEMWQPASQVPAVLSIVDIAGLVPGASEGAGLGNAFLSHINAVDGIYQVVRAFSDPDVIHTEGEVNPVRDLDIIHAELIAKDRQACQAKIEDAEKAVKRFNEKEAKEELELLTRVMQGFENGRMVKEGEWSNKDVDMLNKYLFLTAKPIVYLVNLSTEDYIRKRNRWLSGIQKWVEEHGGGPIIPYSVALETRVFESSPEERQKYLEDNKTTSMINRIIRTGYNILDLIYYFTAGTPEVRCWTIRRGTKAPQAAGVIHTDFERGFICAEVMKYDDFVEHGSEAAVKSDGKLRQHGKDYEVEDGDIIHFKFNVTSSAKK